MSEDRMQLTFMNVNKDSNTPVIATIGLHILSMDLFFSKIKIIKKKDGSFYAAPPSEEYTCNKTGEKKYGNFWWFGEKTSSFFQKEVMKALSTYCEKKKITNPIY
jgi:hypothetical protein